MQEFQANLVYRGSSKKARDTQRNPVLEKKETKQNKTKQKTKTFSFKPDLEVGYIKKTLESP